MDGTSQRLKNVDTRVGYYLQITDVVTRTELQFYPNLVFFGAFRFTLLFKS